MKKRYLSLILLGLLTSGCTIRFDIRSSQSSHSNTSSYSSTSSSSSETSHSSISINYDGITEIGDMIKNGVGKYKTLGTITKKIIDNSSIRIYVQNTNKNTLEEESLLLDNCNLKYSSLSVGIKVSIEGNYSLVNNIPTMNNPEILLIDNVPLSIEPLKLNKWSELNDSLLSRVVKLENVAISSIDKGLFQNESINITIGTLDSEKDNNVLNVLKEATRNNKSLDIIGVITKKNNEFCLEIVNEFDVNLEGKSTVSETRKVSLYAINDFHGAIEPNVSSYEEGILKVGSFLKAKGQEDNTLILNSGDMWQGSLQSNYNRGNLLTDVMNDIQFDAFTLGNHEFDWGQEYIQKNRNRKGPNGDYGYQTPFLASNIYKYDINDHRVGDYADLGEKYVVKTLENGLKVGIIGVIGTNQITSITSQYVDDLTFLNPTNIVKELSYELRNEHQVDVVILDAHTDVASITESNSDAVSDYAGLTKSDSRTNKRYVDAVFCAHSHQNQNYILNGVPFIQASSNGKSYGNIELTVNENGDISCNSRGYIYTSKIPSYYNDESIDQIVTKYDKISSVAGQEVLGNLNGSLESSGETNATIPNLVTTAIYEYALEMNIDIDYAITNNARATLNAGNLTYSDLFKAVPFDNVVYVIQTKGKYIRNRLNYFYIYRADTEPLNDNKDYKVAVIDYLALHRGTNRTYNYFNEFTEICRLTKEGYDIYNYREITADYIRKHQQINVSDYSGNLDRHDKNKISSAI